MTGFKHGDQVIIPDYLEFNGCDLQKLAQLTKRKLSAGFGLPPIYLLSNASLERTNHVNHALGDKQDEMGDFYEIKNAIYVYM